MPAPPPPPAPTFKLGSGSPDQDRGALLQSIRAGKPLKKTVTVDKSAPAIAGKVKGEGTGTSSTTNVNTRSNAANNKGNSINNGNSMGLGGLFAGGMPKLKPTGMRNNLAERDNGNGPAHTGSATLPSAKRGPPPMPPSAAQKPQLFTQKITTESSANHNPETPKISYGKPTLAPKPPTTSSSGVQQKPSPPPKKLNLTISNSVSRAQSMRIPRSPPVLAPTPSSLHQSQDCLNEPQHRPMITRVLRPPQARPPSPPTSRASSSSSAGSGTTSNGVPITRVAPPPPARAPSIPPPPPPHRSSSSATPSGGNTPSTATAMTIRQAPPAPPPPTPPTRGQSLQQRNGLGHTDFEARFADMFHSIATFPAPAPFRGVTKVYNSKTAAAQKQPAPAPPQRSVSNVGSGVLHSPGSRQQPPQPPAAQQWQQQNAASSAC